VIDPYFRAGHEDKRAAIAALCRPLLRDTTPVELHLRLGAANDPAFVHFRRETEERLPRALPTGTVVKIRCWQERAGGPRLHNRYVLTDVGGVQFGDGIERGAAGHQDRLSILDEPSRAELWLHYAGDEPAFDAAGPAFEIVGEAP
jgi:hypothetical protein